MTVGPSGRALGVACAGLVGAAALLWGGSAAAWFSVTPPGRSSIELTGAELTAVPGAAALLALAGVAALVATRGPLRRGLGAVLAAAGAGAGTVAARVALADPFAAEASPALPPGTSLDALRGLPLDVTPAPLLAVAGAAAVALVGAFVLLREPRLASVGGGYGRRTQRAAQLDPDRAAWQELDDGHDPTVGPGPSRPESG